jgi:hypothetical protein
MTLGPLGFRHDVDTTAGHRANKAFIAEHANGFLDSAASDAIFLLQRSAARQRLARPDLPGQDYLPQDARQLEINRLVRVVVKGHMITLGTCPAPCLAGEP